MPYVVERLATFLVPSGSSRDADGHHLHIVSTAPCRNSCVLLLENVGPMTLYMPDGDGGMVERVVSNIQEYRAAWYDEGRRVLMRKDDPS